MIHFPFDIKLVTPTAVAKEMVQELDLTDQDISTIAEMIELEIQSLFGTYLCFRVPSSSVKKIGHHATVILSTYSGEYVFQEGNLGVEFTLFRRVIELCINKIVCLLAGLTLPLLQLG
ncbi:hypothetical protein L1987_06281 [Smallanthus sonchifolius]|uniref:Uncharacterized protein n=1 Tax=Smallanthus sonchifolius TaxID=185202 RepID=A0ACB9JXW5_9ASTR|nr:hypothetical protein L1987_06281 [Smallanthus sonchifolius]